MGRIKSALVKRTAKNLRKEENSFVEDFDKNKVFLNKLTPSKSLRNKIAGYIARLEKAEKKKRLTVNTEINSNS